MLDWADKQVDWVRDALRRHASSPNFALGTADKEAILARVWAAAGADDQALEHKSEPLACSPLTADHLAGAKPADTTTLLCSLGPLSHVALLAKDQTLSFALNGVTLVYGENGSGKSGYCRVAKKICRSLSVDDLIGDVFVAGEKPRAEVKIRYLSATAAEGEEPTAVEWVDGSDTPDALSRISVFDSKNAQLYISRDNRIEYLPAEVALLEQHGRHRDEMNGHFQAEKKNIEGRLKTPLPGGFSSAGTVALLKRLDIKSANILTLAELDAACAWTDAETTELDLLTKTLAQNPIQQAEKLERSATALDSNVVQLEALLTGLSTIKIEALKSATSRARIAIAAETAAATEVFSAEPLAGVGSDPWRLMYQYATQYIASTGLSDTLPEADDGLCALCQQPLSESAADRMKRFRIFLSDLASKEASEARDALEAESLALRELSVPSAASAAKTLTEFASLGEEQAKAAQAGLLPVSLTPSLGVLVGSEVDHGTKDSRPTDVQPGVQARGCEAGSGSRGDGRAGGSRS